MGACANPSSSEAETNMSKMTLTKNSFTRKSRTKDSESDLHSNIFIDTYLYTKLEGLNLAYL